MNFEYEDLMFAGILFSFLLGIFLIYSWKKKQNLVSKFIANSNLKVGVSHILQKFKLSLVFLAFTLAFLSLARPQWGRSDQEFIEKGVDIMLAIDTSKSLLAQDLKPSRFERIKLAIIDLIEKAPGNRFGIVVFAGNAFIQTPLTSDPGALKTTINALQIDMLPSAGSDISVALQEAVKGFDSENDQYRAVVIFSDGEDHSADALTTARALKKQNIKIFSVGAATSEGELIPVTLNSGKSDYHRDSKGNVVMTRLNETVLKSVAEASDGFYVNLQNVNAIDRVYEEGIKKMPQTDLSVKTFSKLNEQFQWPLGFAMILLVIEFLIPQHRPSGKSLQFSKKAQTQKLSIIFLAIALCSAGQVVSASSTFKSAAEAMNTGDYEMAKRHYKKLIERHPNDDRLKFNLATAEYHLGNYQEASDLYRPLLKNEDLKLQQMAYYGLGNINYLQGKGEEEMGTKKQKWETSLKMLEAATKLNPSDSNASSNKSFIENELRNLKQQQQQQQQQQQDQNQDQDQDQQQDRNQNKEEEQKQDNENNNESSDDENGSDQKDNQQPEENNTDEEELEGPSDSEENNTNATQESSGDEEKEKKSPNSLSQTDSADTSNPIQLTKQQIENFLKSVDQKSRFLLFSPTNNVSKKRGRIVKDW